jgi:hypothetical protein
MSRKQRNALLYRVGALILIFVFVFAGVLTANNTTTVTATPTVDRLQPPTIVFPTVPPGGTSVVADYTYFHSSGLMSLPHLVGWDPAAQGSDQGPEQRVEPVGTPGAPGSSQSTLVGVTFINSAALSVVHAFSEKDPARKATTLQQLDQYYDKANLDQAWSNFKGGWTELNRRTEGDLFIINFELRLDQNTYLGRQISRFNQDWLMVLRLVTPNNNPALLDQLQNAILPTYHIWPQTLSTPLSWSAIADYAAGYLIKYPPDWRKVDGSIGRPFTVSGTLGPDTITLVTHSEPGKTIKTEDDARNWIKTSLPNAAIQTVKAETRGDTTGFSVSYTIPDADGNQQSAVVTLLNGAKETLCIANLQSSARGQNLLDESNKAISPDLARVRGSFMTLPLDQLVPTPIPTATPAPSATPANAATIAPSVAPPTAVPGTAAGG